MKTQNEIEAKLKELDEMMKRNMPTQKSVEELRDFANSDKKLPHQHVEMLLKVMGRSSNSISIDAQRFILQWVLYE